MSLTALRRFPSCEIRDREREREREVRQRDKSSLILFKGESNCKGEREQKGQKEMRVERGEGTRLTGGDVRRCLLTSIPDQ